MKTQQTLGNFFSMGTLALYFLLMTLLTQGGEGASIQPSCKLSKPSLMQYFISNQIFSLAQLASLSDNDTSTRLLERYMFNQVEDTNRCYLMKEILDLTLKSMSPVPQPKFQPYLRDVLPFFDDQKNKLASCTLKGNGRLVRKQMDDLKNKLKRDSFPARFGGIHFVNQPWYIHALYTVIRPFLKEKTRKRIFLHGNNLNSLHQLIHPEILPSEFGGMLPPYDMGTWARTLLDHEYDDDSEYNVDSYSMPVKEVEKELSPKSMKRSQSVVDPAVLKRMDKNEEENMQPLLSLD